MSKRGRGPRPLAAAIDDITRPVFGSRGFADGAIVKDWPIIVGAHMGAHSVPEKITYPSTDGLTIPSYLYRPPTAMAGTRHPALVWVHGGPGGQTRTGYRPMLQYLVNILVQYDSCVLTNVVASEPLPLFVVW